MDIKELLKTTPESLANTQFAELKKATIQKFQNIITALKDENFKKIHSMLGDSPAGDRYGCDNMFINFDDILGEDRHYQGSHDISDVLSRLEGLQKIIKK